MTGHYVLDAQGEPVAQPDVLRWAIWFETANRQLAVTTLPAGGRVSTVFLGLDHGCGDGPPILWETMLFDVPGYEDHQERYTSREDAIAGHFRLVAELGGAA